MKYIICIVVFASLFSCGAIVHPTPSTIDKFATFLHVELSVLPKDKKTIFADLSIRNNSKDSLLLYKPLYPFDGKMIFPCFSIFNAETYDQIEFSRSVPKLTIYKDKAIADVENTPEMYFTLHSGETIRFRLNLADWYNFKGENPGEAFQVAPAISQPLIDFNYKKHFERDSVDGQMKPVYYFITLPEKKDIDSMRVKFVLP